MGDNVLQGRAAITGIVSAVLLSLLASSCDCGPQLTELVPLPGSDWQVITEVYHCTSMDAGLAKLFAENVNTHERFEIMHLQDGPSNTTTVRGRAIIIEIPNMVYIESHIDHVLGYDIIVKYTPKDDPVARNQYRFWFKNPSDPEAQRWAQENIYPRTRSPEPM